MGIWHFVFKDIPCLILNPEVNCSTTDFVSPNKQFFFNLRDSPQWVRTSSFTRFLDHTQRRTTVGKTPLGE
jgi:hypothetical protein